ncbi:L-lactate permease [Mechercharimyces sp. CAU 1602]|uniref:L-lactate permease n=1 Tax=Mechercharimyces sp. CAU 1602 TaxID=2973933 RepID=UPI002161F565|nr:L-lactate permease [Mechercharimyces sp. CAU 1602]MCS1350585.1 L-lactate permease [Mechercharimyces sp. CAU 1602]
MITITTILLALSPILTILILLFLFRQSIVRAGLISCLLTFIVAFSFFQKTQSELFTTTIKGSLTTASVAYFLLFGIFLFILMINHGIIRSFTAMIAQATSVPTRQVLILAVAFSPLVESASGFGLAAIVICPILIALGFPPYRATLISLISLTAVPWGSLAAGTVIGAELAGLSPQELGTATALLTLPTFVYFALIMTVIADGWQALKKYGVEIFIVAITLGISTWAFTYWVSVELAGVFAALIALSVEMGIIRLLAAKPPFHLTYTEVASSTEEPMHHNESKWKLLSPYLFLVGLLLFSRLIPAVSNFLISHAVISLPAYNYTIPLLYSPGFFLILSTFFTVILFRIPLATIRTSVIQTWGYWYPVIASTLLFVIIAETMSSAGMTQVLAQAAANNFGSFFLYLSPLIGGLGGFLIGSNTGSNSMLIQMQTQAAQQLTLPSTLIAAAQNTASAHLIMAAPPRVVLGASIGGVRAQERQLLKHMIIVGVGTILCITLQVGLLHLFIY